MWSKKLINQLFLFFLLIMGIPVVFAVWFSSYSFNKFYAALSVEDLTSRAWLIAGQVEEHISRSSLSNIDSLCKSLSKKVKTRFTVISPSGKVIGDSEKNPDSMENHLNRTEVLAAISGTVGISDRFSNTLKKNMLYAAVPVYNSGKLCGIVRTSVPSMSIKASMSHLFSGIFWAILSMCLLAACASYYLSRKICLPITIMKNGAQRFASGNFAEKVPSSGYEETRQLAVALNEMARKLGETINRITEQNHELDAILSSMSEGVIAVDSSERILLINTTAADLFAIDPRRATGKWIGESLRNNEIREFLGRALRADNPIEEELVFPILSSTGESSERYLQLHGSALLGPGLTGIGALAVINDITHLKKLETLRHDFVANVSHELRTPLTSIKGFIETLAAGAVNDPDEARHFLKILGKQADRLNMIVDDLLSLSRIERDTEYKAIDRSETRLADVLGAAIETCRPKARLKNIDIECHCDATVTAKVEKNLIEQAVVNLIDNAIIYSGEKTRIRVNASYTQGNETGHGGEAVISVEDEGAGIAPEHMGRLFERFYRVDKARSRKLGGTGLGLSIVKHIALAHGGRVDVKSAPGRGSTFFIYLPRT